MDSLCRIATDEPLNVDHGMSKNWTNVLPKTSKQLQDVVNVHWSSPASCWLFLSKFIHFHSTILPSLILSSIKMSEPVPGTAMQAEATVWIMRRSSYSHFVALAVLLSSAIVALFDWHRYVHVTQYTCAYLIFQHFPNCCIDYAQCLCKKRLFSYRQLSGFHVDSSFF